MKCPAVACLWPPSPPSHCITAVTVLHHPISLFTGGSDGAIVRWILSSHHVRPLALLCGHSNEIADLSPCFPDAVDADSSNSVSSTPRPSALLSACEGGVLCVWSADCFRCRRRRKLPSWAGSPSQLAAHPSLPRYVCIACSSGESSKCSVLVVDSSTLLVMQNVFHGSLGGGCVKSIVFVPLMEEMEKGKQAVFVVDGHGKAQLLALSKESDYNGEGSSSMNLDLLTTAWVDNIPNDGVQAVAVALDGNILSLIYEFRCEFRSILNGTVIGEVSFPSTNLGNEQSSLKLNLIGGMFLHGNITGSESETHASEECSPNNYCFAFCCSNGSAIVYKISISHSEFNFQFLCEVPAEPLKSMGGSSFHFCQLNDSLCRLESLPFLIGHLLVWKPSITIWSLVEFKSTKDSDHGSCSSCIFPGERGFSDVRLFYRTKKLDGQMSDSFQQSDILNCSNFCNISSKMEDNGLSLEDRVISSSMVLSDDFFSQYAIVYGYNSGEIKLILLLSPSQIETSMEKNLLNYSNPHATKCFFSGHTSAVLCLAAHHMSASSSNLNLRKILLSGSLDCTVRIWDLDSGSAILVMHHHISPVKQLILPPSSTERPWNDCFLSVGEDGCVALVSLETLRAERMFPGHPSYPSVIAWDSRRGYLACLCSMPAPSDSVSFLYLWDVKTGARERIIRGLASHSMLDNFCRGINAINGSLVSGITSASSLLVLVDDGDDSGLSQSLATKNKEGTVAKMVQSHRKSSYFLDSSSYIAINSEGKLSSMSMADDAHYNLASNISQEQIKKHPIICSCPFPGISSLEFDLSLLVSRHYAQEQTVSQISNIAKEQSLQTEPSEDTSFSRGDGSNIMKVAVEGYLLRLSLCFLHLWDIDLELDKLLKEEMDICKPDGFEISAGILGDRGSMTLMFPGLCASLQLWKTSSEYCAMRSLIIVSLAQRIIGLYHSTVAGSALAAFYTRNFAERVQDIKPPLLQLLVSFWQDPSEHVRMAARTLFHCAAPRAIPRPLSRQKIVSTGEHAHFERELASASNLLVSENSILISNNTDCEIVSWLESFEIHEWISTIGGTSQDVMASCIIVAAALVVWYPSKVKENLANFVANRLVKLVMSMNEHFSSTAAELLAEGMESSWKACLGLEIPHLIGDIFFQIECLFGTLVNTGKHEPSMASNIREFLVGILLPSLAMADITSFLKLIEDQIWSTSSDSPIHLVSLKTLVRMVRGSPKPAALHLDKVVNYVLLTMDPSNLVMRKACLKSSFLALKEIARVLPMVTLNESSTRLAVGDAIGEIHNVAIHVYDLESVTKIKILDASGLIGLPSSLKGTSNTGMGTAISALSFSPDGEGLVAFSENGLLLRWWSLGTHWWEKLSINFVPVQCAKLIFVPPWEGFSPNSSRSSIMADIAGIHGQADSEEKSRELDEADRMRLLLHNLDLSYRIQWVCGRNVVLTRHGQVLGTFPL